MEKSKEQIEEWDSQTPKN